MIISESSDVHAMFCFPLVSGPSWPLNLLSVSFWGIVLSIRVIGVMILPLVVYVSPVMWVLLRTTLSSTTHLLNLHIPPPSPPPFFVFLLIHLEVMFLHHPPPLHLMWYLHMRVQIHLHLHLNRPLHRFTLVVPKVPLILHLPLPPWPVLTIPLLMFLMLLMSHKLYLMSYRLVQDIIFGTAVLLGLLTSMGFHLWMLLLMNPPRIKKLPASLNGSLQCVRSLLPLIVKGSGILFHYHHMQCQSHLSGCSRLRENLMVL